MKIILPYQKKGDILFGRYEKFIKADGVDPARSRSHPKHRSNNTGETLYDYFNTNPTECHDTNYSAEKGGVIMPFSKEKRREYNRQYYQKRKLAKKAIGINSKVLPFESKPSNPKPLIKNPTPKSSNLKSSNSKHSNQNQRVLASSAEGFENGVESLSNNGFNFQTYSSGVSLKPKEPSSRMGFSETFKPWVLTLVYSLIVVGLIIFLVMTEIDFYTLKGFSLQTAIFFSSLFHLCKVGLSAAIARSNWKKNCLLIPALLLVVVAVAWISKVSVEKTQEVNNISSLSPFVVEAHSRLKKDFKTKEKEADNHFNTSIKPLGEEWKTKRAKLSKEFNQPEGYGWKKDQALKALTQFEAKHQLLELSKTNASETQSFIYLRWLAIFLTIVFSALASWSAPQREVTV